MKFTEMAKLIIIIILTVIKQDHSKWNQTRINISFSPHQSHVDTERPVNINEAANRAAITWRRDNVPKHLRTAVANSPYHKIFYSFYLYSIFFIFFKSQTGSWHLIRILVVRVGCDVSTLVSASALATSPCSAGSGDASSKRNLFTGSIPA